MVTYTRKDFEDAYNYFSAIAAVNPPKQWRVYGDFPPEQIIERLKMINELYLTDMSARDITAKVWETCPDVHPCAILKVVLGFGGFTVKE